MTHDVEEAVYLGSRVVVMSPYPGRIDSIYEARFARERGAEVRLDPEFLQLKRRIMERVRDTVAASFDDGQPTSIAAGA